MLQHLDRTDPMRHKILEKIVGPSVAGGHHFGYALGLRSRAAISDEVIGVCICYPPGSLIDGEPVPAGGSRDFFIHVEYEERTWAEFGFWMNVPAPVLDRAMIVKTMSQKLRQ